MKLALVVSLERTRSRAFSTSLVRRDQFRIFLQLFSDAVLNRLAGFLMERLAALGLGGDCESTTASRFGSVCVGLLLCAQLGASGSTKAAMASTVIRPAQERPFGVSARTIIFNLLFKQERCLAHFGSSQRVMPSTILPAS